MLSKRKLKFFKSLQIKKYRHEHGMFLVEGAKGVEEALKSDFEIVELLLTETFYNELITSGFELSESYEIVKEDELKSAGTFNSNNAGIAIIRIPKEEHCNFQKGLTLVLDDVRDPGNFGTIIRIADWYGIKQIVCSQETTDLYNPKVINATMGSFTRVHVLYTDLLEFLSGTDLPIYGALLNGESIYKADLASDAIIVMGNESKGISEEIESLINHPVKIPGRGGAESLNVAVATAIVLDNFAR